MLEQALTSTKVIRAESISAADLDNLVTYAGGPEAQLLIIQDNRALEPRDCTVASLGQRRPVLVLDRVFPDPKVEDIMAMANEAREKLSADKPLVILGIGGGSTLDSAKAVAIVLSCGGDLDEYLGPTATRKIERRNAKLILAPTTAGTGSEVTKFGVYTARSGRKYTLNNPNLQADIALLVDEFTFGLPAPITAATAFDALSHALETLWNRNATPVSDLAATQAAIAVLAEMERAYDSAVSGSRAGRSELLEAACMAGIAFNLTGTAAVHAISFILSEEWHVPHGVACAFTLEDVLLLNSEVPAVRAKLARIARLALNAEGTDAEAVTRLAQRLVDLKQKFGLPLRFESVGAKLQANDLAGLFAKSLDDPKMKNNIVAMDQAKLLGLLERRL